MYVTKLPKHEIGQCIVNSLRRFGVNIEYIVRDGERVGVLYLEKGASRRTSKIIYDRKYSAVSEAEPSEYYRRDEIFRDTVFV
jgi:2-dehydro-3-deoxygluconokinase